MLTMSAFRNNFILLQLLLYVSNCIALQCLDEKNNPVDWFYIYKLPKVKNHLNPLICDGVAYMYLTPMELTNGWISSNYSIRDSSSILGKTLSPLYEHQNIISLLYNDQPPHNESFTEIMDYILLDKSGIFDATDIDTGDEGGKIIHNKYYEYDAQEKGHTKGVILGDKLSSLWLIHSVPKFPPIPHGNEKYEYPSTGTTYGQALLCLSFHTQTLDQIAIQLKYNEPLVLYSTIPDELINVLPNLVDVTQNKTVTSTPWHHTLDMATLGGMKFKSFAKSSNFHNDLYSGLVAPSLQTNLLVESWINEAGVLDSDCTKEYQVHNIEGLTFPIPKLNFTSHHDHSKWAVGVRRNLTEAEGGTAATSWICVGDINRALTQESRGGGTVCTLNADIWKNFAQLVEDVQKCKI